ncbi:hypothetical protein ACFLRF_01230, partial [Candidatus Altiarchaeota archaeon]
QAAVNMILGRTLFDDGDEVLMDGKTDELVLADMSQSFRKLGGKYEKQTGLYASHAARTIGRLMVHGGSGREDAKAVVDPFFTSFGEEFKRIWTDYRGNRDEWRAHFQKKVRREVHLNRPVPSLSQWDIRPQWDKILDNLDAIKDEGRIDGIVDAMRKRTDKTLGLLDACLEGLEGKDKADVLTAYNELLSTHPDKVDEFAKLTSRDKVFSPDAGVDVNSRALARKRQVRLRMARINYLTSSAGVKLSDVEDYALEVKHQDPHDALELFECNVGSRFNGLNLTGKDAQLLLHVAAKTDLRARLEDSGYISD